MRKHFYLNILQILKVILDLNLFIFYLGQFCPLGSTYIVLNCIVLYVFYCSALCFIVLLYFLLSRFDLFRQFIYCQKNMWIHFHGTKF